jgi:cupin fold WbuC family metalloprotein
MFIANTRATYVRPHRNLKKSKSFHIIEGSVDVVMFDDVGNIIEVIQMGDYSSGLTFYYRMAEPGYHTLLIRSDFLVFVEATEGPFRRSDTVYAPWAPEESDSFAVKEFREQLTQAVEKFMGSS